MKLWGKKMKRSFALCLILVLLTLVLAGCTEQLGETAKEGHRRHKRVLRLQRQELMADLDALFLMDRPSKLSDKRIP